MEENNNPVSHITLLDKVLHAFGRHKYSYLIITNEPGTSRAIQITNGKIMNKRGEGNCVFCSKTIPADERTKW